MPWEPGSRYQTLKAELDDWRDTQGPEYGLNIINLAARYPRGQLTQLLAGTHAWARCPLLADFVAC